MSTEQNKTIVRDFHEAFDRGDMAAMEQPVSPSCVAYQAGMPGALDFVAYKQVGQMFLGAFNGSRTVILQQIAEGDSVMTRGTWSAIHSGDFQGILATGKSISLPILAVDRIVDGKLVEHRSILDMLDFMQQLGVIPAFQQG
jgi:predicted ester cyclase